MKVTFEVRGYLAVSMDGETRSNGKVITIGKPGNGTVTYVVLDG